MARGVVLPGPRAQWLRSHAAGNRQHRHRRPLQQVERRRADDHAIDGILAVRADDDEVAPVARRGLENLVGCVPDGQPRRDTQSRPDPRRQRRVDELLQLTRASPGELPLSLIHI